MCIDRLVGWKHPWRTSVSQDVRVTAYVCLCLCSGLTNTGSVPVQLKFLWSKPWPTPGAEQCILTATAELCLFILSMLSEPSVPESRRFHGLGARKSGEPCGDLFWSWRIEGPRGGVEEERRRRFRDMESKEEWLSWWWCERGGRLGEMLRCL